eukprot:252248-Rhodomonas_salina.2
MWRESKEVTVSTSTNLVDVFYGTDPRLLSRGVVLRRPRLRRSEFASVVKIATRLLRACGQRSPSQDCGKGCSGDAAKQQPTGSTTREAEERLGCADPRGHCA